MPLSLIISYDDTANDLDALALGGRLAAAGATPALAYVRHATESDPERERSAAQQADDLLARGARTLGLGDVARHVVVHRSTGEGLWELAGRIGAELVVFGSDYRTPVGSVRPATSAQRLLAGGPVAVAIAPAGLRTRAPGEIARIGVLSDGPDLAAPETARSLADASGAEIVDAREGNLDLLVVGSRAETELGSVRLTATAEYAIELSRCPVLVVPRGTALDFRPVLVTV